MNLNDMFTLVGDNPRRNTRSADCPLNIVVKRCNLDVRRNFFSIRVAQPWNDLPSDLKTCPSISMFKANLKTYLLDLNSDMDEQEA